jgi:hypothetical protein
VDRVTLYNVGISAKDSCREGDLSSTFEHNYGFHLYVISEHFSKLAELLVLDDFITEADSAKLVASVSAICRTSLVILSKFASDRILEIELSFVHFKKRVSPDKGFSGWECAFYDLAKTMPGGFALHHHAICEIVCHEKVG